MNYLNPILLGGTAALLAPLVIHLLNRSKFQVVDWGAMHLLDAALTANVRRIHWESLLLLICRCLIPALLALTLARPVLTHFKSAPSSGRESLVVLLDNSSSMAAADDQGSLLSRAIDDIAKLDRETRNTEITSWSTALPMQPLVRTRMNQLVAAGTSSPAEALRMGLHELQSSSTHNRQLLLVSDFQASQWRSMSSSDLQTIKQQAADPNMPCQIILLPVALNQTPGNLAVRMVEPPSFANLNGTYRFSVRVHNYSRTDAVDTRVVFQADGADLASRSLSLAADTSQQLDFACSFSTLGQHSVAIHVEDTGSVHDDDWCFAVVNVTRQPQILIVDDQSQPEKFVGASRYLQLALAPFKDPKQNPFRIDVIDNPTSLAQQLPQAAAVIVAKSGVWQAKSLTALEQFVNDGAGLLVFAQQDDAGSERNALHGFDRLLPMACGMAHSVPSEAAIGIQVPASRPASLDFLSLPRSGLESARCRRWVELVKPSTAAGHDGEVVLELANGLPFIASRRLGKGIVLQCATSCSDDDSNLPREPVFVPLMHSLAELLTRHSLTKTNFTTGELIALQRNVSRGHPAESPQAENQPSAWTSVEEANVARFEIVQPQLGTTAEPPFQVPVSDGQLLFNQTHRAGLYRLQWSKGLLDSQRTDQLASGSLFSVNTAESESDLERLSDEELDQLAQSVGAKLVFSAEEFTSLRKLQRDGREIWRWLLAGLLALLTFEQWLGLRSVRGGV